MENLNIQIGKKYILRNGLLTSEIRKSNNGTNYIFEADVKEPQHETKSVFSWLKNGFFLTTGKQNEKDIIKEY